ncbi:GNAT family N-acetyltransferase [Natrarchaeobius oligotrophus]|uniref:N-acetyltransferase n=1 Tax=Natrarchaeobius chitinivorans TaxID=1679083 RepID=A0A3N6MZB8_NATCH|nr:GNAT family N-acetyltransferase [Natrarchaeobius chitinivorans]RQH01872.1 N-acetyltransferase [Natrarchaeobius chitinivorans]
MVGSRIRVREATPADAESVAAVHAASVRELASAAYDDEQLGAWLANVHPERYPIRETDDGLFVVVAERNGEVVGFGWLDCESATADDGVGEVVAVYVHPDHGREGIGAAILERLESIARAAGLEALELLASKNAIAFYREQGYDGRETVELELQEGVALEAIRMRTRL